MDFLAFEAFQLALNEVADGCNSLPSVVAAAEEMAGKTLDLSQLTWKGFFINNLFPVTLRNFVGGVVLVGVVFWFAYLCPNADYSPLGVKSNFPGDKM